MINNSVNYKISSIFSKIWLLLLIIVAIYVRINGADTYYYHVDELMHINIAKGETLKETMQFSLLETHPPLGHIVRHYWQEISGEMWFSRSLSLVFGIVMIPLYFAIGKKLNGELTGMCAAALVAFSNACVVQSYVVRNYSMFTVFLSAAFYCYLLWRDKKKNMKLLASYGMFALLACLTHFSGIFAVFLFCANCVYSVD